MSLPSFQLLRPKTLDEAVALLAKHDGRRENRCRRHRPAAFDEAEAVHAPVCAGSARRLRSCAAFATPGEGVEIGALTTLSAIEHSALIRNDYPVLYEAVKTVASPVLRNMGTLGGNICLDTRCLWYNQSLLWRKSCGFCLKKDGDLCHVAPGGKFCWAAFSGDTPPALLCLGAELEIAGPTGLRRTPLRDFYVNDGIVRLHLAPNEIVTRVFSAGILGGMARQLSEAAGARQHRLPAGWSCRGAEDARPAAWKTRGSQLPRSILRRIC